MENINPQKFLEKIQNLQSTLEFLEEKENVENHFISIGEYNS